MLSALVVGAAGIQLLEALGLTAPIPITPTYVAGNLLGGALFGVGMALGGFCPGTIVAGAAEGSLDYAVPGIAGLLTGALVFGWAYPSFFPALSRIGRAGSATFASLLGVEPWKVLVLFAEVVLLLFYVLERGRRGPGMSPAASAPSDPHRYANRLPTTSRAVPLAATRLPR